MTSLIACLGQGKGSWLYLTKLLSGESWDNVFLVTNRFGMEKYKPERAVNFVIIDEKRTLQETIDDITKQLKEKISETEIALNLISGTGKEHMAILSACLKLGLGIRLVAFTKDGVKEI